MKTYIIHPYFGYDCDSNQGFNNGRYLHEIEVQAEDEQAAIDVAMDLFVVGNPEFSGWERDGWFGENTLYFEGPTTDENGNEVDTADPDFEFDERKHGYMYQYVDFSDCEVKE